MQNMLSAGAGSGQFDNSAGESDSTNSPLSTDDSHEAEAESRTFSSQTVPTPVAGACRRGRRNGRRYRASAERADTNKEDRRIKKNSKERKRVQNVNQEYISLRTALGAPPNDKVAKPAKVATLNHAIVYIKALMNELEQLRTQAGETPLGPSGDGGPSCPSGGVEIDPAEGRVGYNLRSLQHSSNNQKAGSPSGQPAQGCIERATQTQSSGTLTSPNLSCNETFELDDPELVDCDTVTTTVGATYTAYNEEVHVSSVASNPPPGSYFSTIYSPDPPLSAAGSLFEPLPVPLTPGPASGEVLLSPPTGGSFNVPLLPFLTPGLLHELTPFPPSTLPLSHEAAPSYPICTELEDRTPTWMVMPPPTSLSPSTLTHYPPAP